MNSERIRTCIDTEYQVGGRREKGKILNISEGGVFVGTRSVPSQGESVDVVFKAPGGQLVKLSGLIWWTTDELEGALNRAPGFGLRMLEANEGFRDFWASLA